MPGPRDDDVAGVGQIVLEAQRVTTTPPLKSGKRGVTKVVYGDVGTRARRATAPTSARGRVQLRRRESDGALLGDDGLEAGPGDLVFSPRGEWHTFWNAGDEPCQILEIIAPAAFEGFFSELVDLGGVAQAEPEVLAGLCERYALEMDPSSIPALIERFGVCFPGKPLSR